MRTRLWMSAAAISLGLLSVSGCQSIPTVGNPHTEQPTRGTLEAGDNADQARAISLVEKVTGWHFSAKFPVYIFTPEELSAEIADWQKEDPSYQPHNIMGFYKPETRSMYLVPETAGNKRAFGLRVHEAAHAMQDQQFGLAKLHEMAKTTDEQRAMTALIEGHAVQVMIDALKDTNPNVTRIAEVQEKPNANLDDPAAMTAFCYAAGTRFVQAIREHGIGDKTGNDAVRTAFHHPPISPNEIRHPDKYLARVQAKAGRTH